MRLMRLFGILTLLTVLGLLTVPAQATVYTLTNNNASLSIQDTSIPDVSQASAYNWLVDGINNLYQQWFWYRIGDTLAQPIDALGLVSATPVLTTRGLDLTYGNSGLSVDILYILSGANSGSGRSDASEIISLSNLGTTALDLHFFQYSDFDLNGTSEDQTVTFTNANTVVQAGGGIEMTETADVPTPSRHEANTFANTLYSLNSVRGYNLSNQNTAFGDVTWAFQWDVTLAVGGSFQISKDKILEPSVPEPAAIFGLGTVLLLVGSRLRKRVRA